VQEHKARHHLQPTGEYSRYRSNHAAIAAITVTAARAETSDLRNHITNRVSALRSPAVLLTGCRLCARFCRRAFFCQLWRRW
jgi:hypothetical protein